MDALRKGNMGRHTGADVLKHRQALRVGEGREGALLDRSSRSRGPRLPWGPEKGKQPQELGGAAEEKHKCWGPGSITHR